jgi:dsDNA-specific endonuclease/ATPase MutS2
MKNNKENSKELLVNESEFPEPFDLEITDTIDLHGFAPEDIKSVVRVYLREAYSKGFRTVRIIHGKGIGVQRAIVRKILEESDFVESFKTADEFTGGGIGTTIVFFRHRS